MSLMFWGIGSKVFVVQVLGSELDLDLDFEFGIQVEFGSDRDPGRIWCWNGSSSRYGIWFPNQWVYWRLGVEIEFIGFNSIECVCYLPKFLIPLASQFPNFGVKLTFLSIFCIEIV